MQKHTYSEHFCFILIQFSFRFSHSEKLGSKNKMTKIIILFLVLVSTAFVCSDVYLSFPYTNNGYRIHNKIKHQLLLDYIRRSSQSPKNYTIAGTEILMNIGTGEIFKVFLKNGTVLNVNYRSNVLHEVLQKRHTRPKRYVQHLLKAAQKGALVGIGVAIAAKYSDIKKIVNGYIENFGSENNNNKKNSIPTTNNPKTNRKIPKFTEP